MKFVSLIACPCLLALMLPGCVRTAYNVATAPVKAGGKVVDWTTTSGEEADRNRGRELRKKCKKQPDDYYCRKD